MRWLLGLFMLFSVFILIACERNDGDQTVEGEEAIKLVMLQEHTEISADNFKKWIIEPVSKKYPYIAMDLRTNIVGPRELEYLITKGEFPDIALTSLAGIMDHRVFQTALDLMPLIHKLGFDLAPFDQTALEAIRNGDQMDHLYALPLTLDFGALYYNIDRFDQRKADYPTDGMTWDDAIELSRKFGLYSMYPPQIADLGGQLSLRYVDPVTGRADIHNDRWLRVLLLNKAIHEIRFNAGATPGGFVERRDTAMMVNTSRRLADLEIAHERGLTMNWDLVQYPSYPDQMNIGPRVAGQFLIISTLSAYQEEALQVISVITSAENQLAMAKSGIPSARREPEMQDHFAVDNSFLRGKNYSGMFKSGPAQPYVYTVHDPDVLASLVEASQELAKEQLDINTVFRIAQEKANQWIEARNMGFE